MNYQLDDILMKCRVCEAKFTFYDWMWTRDCPDCKTKEVPDEVEK